MVARPRRNGTFTTMIVAALGVGSSASRLRDSTALVVGDGDDHWLLIDCPHPIRRMLGGLARAGGPDLDLGDLDAVVLTHLHADHCSGLEPAGFHSRFELGRALPLAAHPRVSAGLWDGHLASGMRRTLRPSWLEQGGGYTAKPHVEEEHAFADYFTLTDLDDHGPVCIGPFTIEARFTRHVLATTALRIRVGDASFAYSADTCFDGALLEWLAEADWFAHEAGWGIHADPEKLARSPWRERMRLVHYPDDLDPEAYGLQALDAGDVISW